MNQLEPSHSCSVAFDGSKGGVAGEVTAPILGLALSGKSWRHHCVKPELARDFKLSNIGANSLLQCIARKSPEHFLWTYPEMVLQVGHG